MIGEWMLADIKPAPGRVSVVLMVPRAGQKVAALWSCPLCYAGGDCYDSMTAHNEATEHVRSVQHINKIQRAHVRSVNAAAKAQQKVAAIEAACAADANETAAFVPWAENKHWLAARGLA